MHYLPCTDYIISYHAVLPQTILFRFNLRIESSRAFAGPAALNDPDKESDVPGLAGYQFCPVIKNRLQSLSYKAGDDAETIQAVSCFDNQINKIVFAPYFFQIKPNEE